MQRKHGLICGGFKSLFKYKMKKLVKLYPLYTIALESPLKIFTFQAFCWKEHKNPNNFRA